ncbi:MAG: hypothetical protein KIT02_08230 [Devosia sp.]|uniref:hypothetical protein n=1 Tax=Devosia sp. TaxID=1871048 RepID=UPI0024C65B43|nr:hypothetical protein [Devosia sp.]UYO01173.1 MAG: hypothetical protein KIT02_08230 [Devosia sp.]
MHRALALIAILALAAQPALAQGKTKTAPADEAIGVLETCEAFATGDVLALDDAVAAGWDAYDNEGESPYVRSYDATIDLHGLGWVEMFALVETYPDRVLGYCRIDAAETRGNAQGVIEAIAALDRYDGEVQEADTGTYASLTGTGSTETMLLTHWDDIGFVVQLTIISPRAQSGE